MQHPALPHTASVSTGTAPGTPGAMVRPDPRWERYARLLVLGVCIGFGIGHVLFAISGWTLVDVEAYWGAAMRLREGGALYPVLDDPTTADVYRYAPWFAWAWVPLTYLPRGVVEVAWSVALLGAVAAVLYRVLVPLTVAGAAVAGLLGGLLLLIASVGNVHPLLVAALVFGVERRSGPLWVALAASLKAVPILFVVVYLARGEWRRAALAVVLTALLVAPMLLYDLSAYPFSAGELSLSLANRAPAAWVALTVLAVGVTWWAARRRSSHDWLAASVAALVALPRAFPYDLTLLLAGVARPRSR